MLLVVAATERELACVPDGTARLCCGIGPVEAAIATATALAVQRPSAVLHVGIAGAHALDAPALVLGSESVYEDVLDPGSTLERVWRVEPDAGLLAAAHAALPKAHVLPIATAGRVGGASLHGVEAMEGFGVLRAAELAGVPAVELRAISNAPGEPDRSRWKIAEALAALDDTVPRLVAALG